MASVSAAGTLARRLCFKAGRSISSLPARGLGAAAQAWRGMVHAAPPESAESTSSGATAAAPPPPRPRPVPPPRAPPGVMLGPDGQPLKVVPVEKAGPEAWAGVASVDDGKETDLTKALAIAGGDVAALLAFAAVGRASHGWDVVDFETLATAGPFIAGWLATAPFLGGYGPKAQGKEGVAPAALTAAKCWAVGAPVGLAVRTLTKGYLPPTAFIVVSLASTAVFLVGWRTALAALTKPEAPKTAAQQLAARKDKQGNPFEFIQLLMSLTKRW